MRVRILGTRADGRLRWVQVDLSSGRTGWIPSTVALEPASKDAASARGVGAAFVDGPLGQAIALFLVLGGAVAVMLAVSRGASPHWGAVVALVGVAGLVRSLLRRRAGAAAIRGGPPR